MGVCIPCELNIVVSQCLSRWSFSSVSDRYMWRQVSIPLLELCKSWKAMKGESCDWGYKLVTVSLRDMNTGLLQAGD
jgi:hypothetical protein